LKKSLFSLKGFTVIELVIVVVILSILAAVGLVQYSNVTEKARSAEAYAVLADIAAAETSYYLENNAYVTGTGNNWASLDRYSSEPLSDNFTFTLDPAHYGKAAPKPGKGTNTYYMCFNGTNKGTSAPTCP